MTNTDDGHMLLKNKGDAVQFWAQQYAKNLNLNGNRLGNICDDALYRISEGDTNEIALAICRIIYEASKRGFEAGYRQAEMMNDNTQGNQLS